MSVSIACLCIPDLPLEAVRRNHPQLQDKPLAITDGHGTGGCILSVSVQASSFGIHTGMSQSQARILSSDVVFVALEHKWIRSTMDTLKDVALSFSPRVGPLKQGYMAGRLYGYVCMDAKGLSLLHGDEKALGKSIVRAAEKVGLNIRVGSAYGVEVAKLAALSATATESVCVVSPGHEAEFLAPLPLDVLSLSGHLVKMLDRFGIRTMGRLAALPERGLKLRLGQDGMKAWRLSRGESLEPFVAERPDDRFVERAYAGWAMSRIDSVLAEFERVLTRLADRLRCRGLVARALVIRLELESGYRWERQVEPASPCSDVKVWLDAVELALCAEPPDSPVEELEAQAVAVRGRAGQGDLFRRTGLAPSRKLDEVMARLGAMTTREGLGSPMLLNTHRPDPVEILPVGRGGAEFVVRPGACVAIRRFRPPLRAEVIYRHGRPVSLSCASIGGRITKAVGPWRLRWGWWEEHPVRRDYYDVELGGGGLYRLFSDLAHTAWFVDGILG